MKLGTGVDLLSNKDSTVRLGFLKGIFSRASDAVLVTEAGNLDEPGPKIIYANAAFHEMSGYSSGELAGRTPRVLQGPGTDRAELDRIRHSLERAEPIKAELLNYRKGGGEFWVEMDLVPVYGDEETSPEYWVSVQRETTLSRRAGERLRDTEKILRAVLSWHESEMVLLLEFDGRTRYESPAVKRTLGYRYGEISRRELWRRVHPEDRARLSGSVRRCMATPGKCLPIEVRVRSAEGLWRWLEVVIDNRTSDPEVRGVFIRGRDVTDRREAEEALRESEERFRSLVHNSSEIIRICDPDGTLRYASPSLERILGYKPEEMVGRNVLEFVHPEDLPRVLQATREALEVPGVVRNTAEYRSRHADGSWRHMETSGTYLLDEPTINGVLINTRDVTDRKEAEAALTRSEARYRSQARELGLLHRVRSALAREIRAPEIFQTVVEAIAETFGYTQVSAYLVEGETLVLQHQVGYETSLRTIPFGSGVMSRVIRTGEAELLEDVSRDAAFIGAMEGIESEVCVPLYDEGEVIGALNVESLKGTTLTPEDLRLTGAVGEHVGIAIGRARLHDQVTDAERKYRNLVERISAVTYTRDRGEQERLLYISPQIETMTGYPAGEYARDRGLWLGSVLHPDDRERVEDLDLRSRRTGEPFSAEYRILHREGGVIWVLDEAVPAEGSNDRVWQGVVLDITARKEAEAALRQSEERFRTAFEDASTGVALVDLDNRFLRANRALCEMIGYSEHEILGKRSFDLTHPEDLEKSRSRTRTLLAGAGPDSMSLEKRYVRKDGSFVWAISDISLVRDSDGEPRHFITQVQNITRRKSAEESLKESEARLASVTSGAPVILFALDHEGTILLSEGKGLESLGLGPYELIGCSVFECYRHLPDVIENVRRALGGEEVRSTVALGGLTFDSRYSPVLEDDGSVSGVIGVATDITERLKLERELAHRAFHDPLTDLANRALCIDRISHALDRLGRDGSSVAVLFMDVDDFKVVNDSFGHHTGDELLVEISRRLKRCLRPKDTLARLGGDEFVMLVENAGLGEAVAVAERIEGVLALPFFLGERAHERHVSVSIGITATSSAERGAEELLREADLAMYQVKDEGRARYGVFDSRMSTRVRERVELESQLRRALKGGQFEVYYQPVISLSGGGVVAFEALTRWRHPERGVVQPSEFIPLMEETGLIIPLGRLVLEEACRALAGWRRGVGEGSLPSVCVNLSARQFRHSDLSADVACILEKTGVPPETLYLEITESVAMADASHTEALADLKRLGVGLMIDDFGTGHSSLAYLKELPVDFLKIDRSFSSGLGEDALDEEIVSAIVRMGHAAELEVIAEGVETREQLAHLEELGCDYAQGYYFSRPVPAREVPGLMKSLSR